MESSLYPDNPILMIDDELQFLRSASFALRSQGINNIVLTIAKTDAPIAINCSTTITIHLSFWIY